MTRTFGLCPQKSKPRRERRIVAFQTRTFPVDPFGSTRLQRATQDAEGNLAVCPDQRIYGRVPLVYYPRALWRLADERNAKPL